MNVAVVGAGGFIGGHLARELDERGYTVLSVDVRPTQNWWQKSGSCVSLDATDTIGLTRLFANHDIEQAYLLAANMGGIGFIENHKLDCMLSVKISVSMLEAAFDAGLSRVLYTSSACVYPDYRQDIPDIAPLRESDAYPAAAEDGYGWEKLFTERLCRHYDEITELQTRVARLHNVYGPYGAWNDGREKAPAAICRKVAEALITKSEKITIWGDGEQTRSFTYVDDCVSGLIRLISDNDVGPRPVNIGSSEMVTINDLVSTVERIAGVEPLLRDYNVAAPQGVRGRSSDNTLIRELLDWEPSTSLADGIARTYPWVYSRVQQSV